MSDEKHVINELWSTCNLDIKYTLHVTINNDWLVFKANISNISAISWHAMNNGKHEWYCKMYYDNISHNSLLLPETADCMCPM